MGLVKEPLHVDLSTKSQPWTAGELAEFRKIMQKIKDKNRKQKERKLLRKGKNQKASS